MALEQSVLGDWEIWAIEAHEFPQLKSTLCNCGFELSGLRGLLDRTDACFEVMFHAEESEEVRVHERGFDMCHCALWHSGCVSEDAAADDEV